MNTLITCEVAEGSEKNRNKIGDIEQNINETGGTDDDGVCYTSYLSLVSYSYPYMACN